MCWTSFGGEKVEWACMITLYDAKDPNSFEEAKDYEHCQHAMQ